MCTSLIQERERLSNMIIVAKSERGEIEVERGQKESFLSPASQADNVQQSTADGGVARGSNQSADR
jgi:hypothetical protein